MGLHRARHQAGGAVAAAGLAHRRAVRAGGGHPAGGLPLPAARRQQPGRPGLGRRGLRGHDSRPERRRHADQRVPRGASRRGHAGAGGDHRGAAVPQYRASRGLGWLRGVAGRGLPGGRRRRRWRDDDRRRPGSGIAADVSGLYRGADPPAGGARPAGRDGPAVPRRHAGHAAGGGHDRGDALRGRRGAGPAGHGRAGAGGHAAAIRALRLRAVPRIRGGGRALPQP